MTELSTWMSWCHENYSLEESAQFVNSRGQAAQTGEWYSFGIFEADTGRFLGGTGLNFINRVHQMGNLGYWVRTSATGRGVASRAARLVARFGFEQVGLQRIEILAAVGNVGSQRVAEKAAAVREAVLRKRLLIHGEPHDAVLFSLTAEDLGV
jgi:RimJ/RimL family protein N-acetyltransferase